MPVLPWLRHQFCWRLPWEYMNLLDFWSSMTGVVLPYAGASSPSGWLLCFGQSLLRSDYPELFTSIGTTYGAADGTHFNVPDLRGRVPACKDDMGGSAASRLNTTLTGTRASTSSGVITGLSSTAGLAVGMRAVGTGIGASAVINSIDSGTQVTLSVNSASTGSGSIRFGVVDGATLGSTGGTQSHTLITSQMPAHNHGVTDPGHTHGHNAAINSGGSSTGGGAFALNATGAATINSASTGISTQNAGSGFAHPLLQPTVILNYIIKT